MTDIVIVPYTDDAKAFVYDSFVRSWCDAARGGNDGAQPTELAQSIWQAYWNQCEPSVGCLHRYLDLVLARSSTHLACAAESPSAYIAWMSATDDTLEYVYVKRAARRLGIARDLMAHHGPLTRQALVTWPWTATLTRKDPK